MLIIMEIAPILIVLTFIVFVSEAYKSPTWATSTSRTPCALFGAKLLPNPLPNSIGNFFEKDESMSFIQCYMLSVADIEGVQYGVGFPVDMPVMLCYFDGNELIPVRPEYPDYDHLVNHVSMQMDDNDFQLYKTPVALTLQGEFEDEELNQVRRGLSYIDTPHNSPKPHTYSTRFQHFSLSQINLPGCTWHRRLVGRRGRLLPIRRRRRRRRR